MSAVAQYDKKYLDEDFALEVNKASDGALTYTSSDPSVATVDAQGKVHVVGAGEATLTVSVAQTANYNSDSAQVKVTVAKIGHTLTVSELEYELTYGDDGFTIIPVTGDNESVLNFSSDNENVATVDNNGKVTLGNTGTATITVSMAESGNYLATEQIITVKVAPKAVTVTPDALTKTYGDADPDWTYTVNGLVGDDALDGIVLKRDEGEDVGQYEIYAEVDETANPNYAITFAQGFLTVTPRSIETAQVKLGKVLTSNGSEQTQEIEQITLDGSKIPADGYVVSGNKATEPGAYEMTIKGTGNYTGELKITYVVAPSKSDEIVEDTDGAVKIGAGTLTVEVKAEENAPKTSMNTSKAELINMLIENGGLTADELAQIANGAKLDVVLIVKDGSSTITAESKKQIADAVPDYTIGSYLDISMFKYLTVDGDTTTTQLHETAKKVSISIQIPDDLVSKDNNVERTYYVIRNHDGKVEVLDSTYDAATKTITFETDRFSDYALAYWDTVVNQSNTNTAAGSNSNAQTSPKTADTAIPVFAAIMMVSAAGAVLLLRKRKEQN